MAFSLGEFLHRWVHDGNIVTVYSPALPVHESISGVFSSAPQAYPDHFECSYFTTASLHTRAGSRIISDGGYYFRPAPDKSDKGNNQKSRLTLNVCCKTRCQPSSSEESSSEESSSEELASSPSS